ncbi:hypothetical protein CTI12_AA227470 [Artemisia annua]|uniref:Uncharacterized protein n=1 Tax=Artemisia annua TaxID=35608 RepID=A0A2U1NUF6_ARTAN|nr:hypothetical protein CTI12_AA227470 [Artemisia annua]
MNVAAACNEAAIVGSSLETTVGCLFTFAVASVDTGLMVAFSGTSLLEVALEKTQKEKKPMNPTTTSGYCDTTFAPPEYQEYQSLLPPPPVDDAENVMVPDEGNVLMSSLLEGVCFENGVWPFCGS